MLYEVTHFIKDRLPWLWEIIERINSGLFLLRYRKGIRKIPAILSSFSNGKFIVSLATENDSNAMSQFFLEQPKEAYTFFQPHAFDCYSLVKLIKRSSFLMFLVKDGDKIVGYFFLRCFADGKAFKGRIVDYRCRNQGIAKLMGNIINEIVIKLKLRLFTTISPENYASLASTKAVNDIKIVRTLDNGYYYIECTPKKQTE
ncbi:MAG: transcriptional regulator [Bacteroidaceae bacterium]|nr:transcriptional regulator [Bacteroidaceae bacterium]